MTEFWTREEAADLRRLAEEVGAIAELDIQAEKRAFWKRHNTLRGERPAVFISPDNSWLELIPPASLRCVSPLARELEYELRQRLARHCYLPDDVPVSGLVRLPKAIRNTMWGVEPKRVAMGVGEAWHHVPIIEKEADWARLRCPEVSCDEALSRKQFEAVSELFDGCLAVESVGVTRFSFHLIHWYCDYRGMEPLYTDLIDAPDMVHRVLRFFTDGVKSMLRQYQELNLLSLNNDETLHYTGGIGCNDAELPRPGFDPAHVRLADLWAAAEAQEFCNVSPAMHEEFALQYERELLEPFGLNGYGCCDDLGKKLDGVLKIRNLRRVAVCPWADIDDFRPRLGADYLMTWKPQPAHLSYERWDEAAIEAELVSGIRKARGGRLELILRDTNTCLNRPERFADWVRIARRAIAENWA
jgi:hypothetical protein